MIEIIFWTLVFYVPFASAHGKLSQNLAQVREYKNKRLANIYKGEWHTLFLLARIALHLGLIYFVTDFKFTWDNLYIALASVLLGVVSYSPILDWARGLNPFTINATCEQWEGSFDWDCITIWIRDHLKINTKILWLVLYVVLVAVYYLL